jgi:hypothetical protein
MTDNTKAEKPDLLRQSAPLWGSFALREAIKAAEDHKVWLAKQEAARRFNPDTPTG